MSRARYDADGLRAVWLRMRRLGRSGLPRRLATGVDGVRADEFELCLDQNLAEIVRRIARPGVDGPTSYRFGPLLRIVQPKGGGKGERALHVARIRDQLVLRAVHEDLLAVARESVGIDLRTPPPADVVDRFREDVRTVPDAFVLRTDIRAFFDSAPRARLVREALDLGLDGTGAALLQEWARDVRARPAWRAGRSHDVSVDGLPQGLAISASLAELLGHLIDRAATPRFRWYRYVDDILLICGSMREAVEARRWVTETLAVYGLELSPTKTTIQPFAEGVSWLGLTHGPDSTRADPSRVHRWVAHFASMRRRAGVEIRAAETPEQARAVALGFERAVRAEVEGRTSTRAAWYALVDDEAAFRDLDRSVHALVRSVRRSVGLPAPEGRALPSVHRHVRARRSRLPAPSIADQGPCATLPARGGPTADQGQKAPDGAGRPPPERSAPAVDDP